LLLNGLLGFRCSVSFFHTVGIQVYLVAFGDVVGGNILVLYLAEVGLEALRVVAERANKVVSYWVHYYLLLIYN
jgi:hypothetical protein